MNRAAEPIRSERILAEPQPFSLPWISANTSRNSDPEKVTRPIQSTPVAFGSRDSLDLAEREEHGGHADRNVDEEDPFPADARGDHAADDGADRDGRADHAAENAEGDATLLAMEGLRDQRERGREHHRPAGALDGAREVEHQRAGGQTAHG